MTFWAGVFFAFQAGAVFGLWALPGVLVVRVVWAAGGGLEADERLGAGGAARLSCVAASECAAFLPERRPPRLRGRALRR